MNSIDIIIIMNYTDKRNSLFFASLFACFFSLLLSYFSYILVCCWYIYSLCFCFLRCCLLFDQEHSLVFTSFALSYRLKLNCSLFKRYLTFKLSLRSFPKTKKKLSLCRSESALGSLPIQCLQCYCSFHGLCNNLR